MYCSKCGKEVPDGAVFCPVCGAKQNGVRPEVQAQSEASANSMTENLRKEFSDIIRRQVLLAYGEETGVDLESLYKRADEYQFEKAMVDQVAADIQEKVDQFDRHLTKRILGGELRLLSVTEDLKADVLRFGKAIGLDEKTGDYLLDRFLVKHEVEERHNALRQLLASFNVDGKWDIESLPEDIRPSILPDVEQLKAAVEEIEKELCKLHRASGKMELSDKDMKKLLSLGRKLGFEMDGYVEHTVIGLERKNGYIAKKLDRETQEQREEESEMFADGGMQSIPTKRTELFNVPLVFPGSFFIEQDVNKILPSFFQKIGEEAIKACNKWSSNYLTDAKTPDIMDEWADSWLERAKSWVITVAMGYGLDSEFTEAVINELADPIDDFADRLHEIAGIYRELDGSVSQAMLEGQIEKAFRSQPVMFGQGVKGIIGAAAAQKLFDAGTGLLYDVKNSMKIQKAEDRAASLKQSVLMKFEVVVRGFSEELSTAAPKAFLSVLEDAYPYAVWSLDEDEYALLLTNYENAADDDIRRRLSAQLLQEDPFDGEDYDRCITELIKEPVDQQLADMPNLVRIAEWFGVDLKKQRERFVNAALKRIASEHPVDDMLRYDLLLRVEDIAGTRTDQGKKIFSEYVSSLIGGLQDYSPESVLPIVRQISTFEAQYRYYAYVEKRTLVQTIAKKNGIHFTQDASRSMAALEAEIAKAEALIPSYRGLDFSAILDPMRAQLQQLKARAAAQEEAAVLSKIHELYDGIDPDDLEKKGAVLEQIYALCKDTGHCSAYAETLREQYEKQKEAAVLSKIHELYDGIDPDDLEKKGAVLEQIYALCKDTGHCSAYAKTLREQYEKAVETAKHVGGITYNTLEEANTAREELKAVEQVYGKNGSYGLEEVKAFSKLSQMHFTSESGKKEYARREQHLIKSVSAIKEPESPDTEKLLSKTVSFFLLSAVGIIVGAVLATRQGWPLKILGTILIGAWFGYIDEAKSNISKVSKASSVSRASHKNNAIIGGCLLVTMVGTVVGIILLTRPGWFMKVLGVSCFLWWTESIDIIKSSRERISDAAEAESIKKAFDAEFYIEDDHIKRRT